MMLSLTSMSMDTLCEDQKTADDENLWLKILNGLQEKSSIKLSSCKTLLVLGDSESGKTSLITKLKETGNVITGSGIEYHSLNVRDEYGEQHTPLSVWVLDGDPWHKNLLKFALHEDNFSQTVVLLTASMMQPWNILYSLQLWISILNEHIRKLEITEDALNEYRQNVLKRFLAYEDLCDSIDSILSHSADDSEGDIFSLDNHTLSDNLGLDIIVVITKTDHMATLEKESNYTEQHFDFIQQAVRKFCLKYGASLLYTSIKEDKNCDLLFKFLTRKVYSYPFVHSASFLERDAIFIPAGWDNMNKISVLYENLTTISQSDPYDEVIFKPLVRTPLGHEVEVVSEDDQIHLLKMQNLLSQEVPAYGPLQIMAQDSVRYPGCVQKTSNRRILGSPSGGQNSYRANDDWISSANSETIRQTFNNLLNTRSGSPTQKSPHQPSKPTANDS